MVNLVFGDLDDAAAVCHNKTEFFVNIFYNKYCSVLHM